MKKILLLFMIKILQLASGELPDNKYVSCDYETKTYHFQNNILSCIVKNSPKVHQENVTLEFFHEAGKDPKALEVTSKEYFYMPLGIEESFQNLICLTIRSSKLKKIRSDNLKPFNNLEYLDLSGNELSVLESNLFQHNKDLITIWLSNNTIFYIDSTAFVALVNIKYFYFYNNSCYSFMSRSYEELVMDQKVSLCSIPLSTVYGEITEFNKQRIDDAILTSLRLNLVKGLTEKLNAAHTAQSEELEGFLHKLMNLKNQENAIVMRKDVIYIIGACIIALFTINVSLLCCIIFYIKSSKTTPQNNPTFKIINDNYEELYSMPKQSQSDEAMNEDLYKIPDNYEEVLNANVNDQHEEGLYSEVVAPLENFLQKTEEDDNNSQLYAVVLNN